MGLIDRAKNMLMTPKTEWAVVATEDPDPMKVFMGYVVPWIVIDAICAFVGHALIWGSGHYGAYAMTWGIYSAVLILVTGGISVWVTALIISALAPSFGSEKSTGRAMQTVAYASTASYVGGILAILPFIGWIGGLFGLYGIYLFYLGLPHTMKTPADKTVMYMVVSAVCLIVVYMILMTILTGVFMGIFGLGVLSGAHTMPM